MEYTTEMLERVKKMQEAMAANDVGTEGDQCEGNCTL